MEEVFRAFGNKTDAEEDHPKWVSMPFLKKMQKRLLVLEKKNKSKFERTHYILNRVDRESARKLLE